MKRLLIFILYCWISLVALNAQSSSNILQTFDSLTLKVNSISFSNKKQAYQLIDQLYQIAKQHTDSTTLTTKALVLNAEVGQIQGFYDSTLTCRIAEELTKITPAKSPYLHSLLTYALAMNHLTQWNLSESFTLAIQASNEFKQLNDSLYIAKSLHILGRIVYHIGSLQLAENYLDEARKYANPSENEYYRILFNLYITSAKLDKSNGSIDSLIRMTTLLDETCYQGFLALDYLNIGVIYSMQGRHDLSFLYYTRAKKLSEKIDNDVFIFSLYLNIGRYYYLQKEYDKSYSNLLTAKTLAHRTQSPNLIGYSYLALSYLHELRHNIDSAFYYIKEYNRLQDRSNINANLMDAYRAYISVFLERSQKELIIKEQEVLLNKRRYIVTILSAAGIIILFASLLRILYLQKRHIRQQSLLKDVENHDLGERLEAKQKIEKLQKEKIAAKERELSSYSLALSNKNNILLQIANTIDRDDTKAIGEIRRVIKNNLNTDNVWQDFVMHFDKVHPEFFIRIKNTGTDLSENDLRLCAYLRISMSTKQIAQMLNVSPESIRMHRYRVKKKLGLAEEQNLDDFIRNI